MSDDKHAMQETQAVTLLLVEDNNIDAEIIQRAFEKRKIANTIVRAHDGAEALDLLRDGKSITGPYLILLDIHMPIMDGHEFLAELRSDPKLQHSVVFVLTSSDNEVDLYKSYQMNVAGYIVKNRAGEDFMRLSDFLQNYWLVVTPPTARAAE